MKNNFCCQHIAFCFLTFIFLLMSGNSIAFAQESTLSENQIRALINKSANKNNQISDEAQKALAKLDIQSMPALKDILGNGTLCEQVAAAQIILELNGRDNTTILPQIIELAYRSPNKSLYDSKDWGCRRGAAFLLPYSAAGIRALTKLLTNKSLYLRQNAIFGFDDLTEVGDYKGDSLQAIKEAIPIIARATNEKDKIVSEMSDEVLTQISDDPRTENLVKSAREKLAKKVD